MTKPAALLVMDVQQAVTTEKVFPRQEVTGVDDWISGLS